jgi:hypothetical protein
MPRRRSLGGERDRVERVADETLANAVLDDGHGRSLTTRGAGYVRVNVRVISRDLT